MASVWIEESIHKRLKRLAERKGIHVHRLATLYLEMAVSFEEAQGRTEATAILEEVLRSLISEKGDELSGVQPAPVENHDP